MRYALAALVFIGLWVAIAVGIGVGGSLFKTPSTEQTGKESGGSRDQQQPSLQCFLGYTIFQEDFEYTDDIVNHGWVRLSTAGSTLTQPDIVTQGSLALKMSDSSSSSVSAYTHTIPTLGEDFQFDFDLLTEQYGQRVGIQLWGGRFQGINVELSDQDNRKFRIQDEYYFVHQLNKWYHVRLMVKPAMQSFDAYVDDMNNPLAKDIKFFEASFGTIAIATATGGTGAGYWDSIAIKKCL